jgi:hypothetical protein
LFFVAYFGQFEIVVNSLKESIVYRLLYGRVRWEPDERWNARFYMKIIKRTRKKRFLNGMIFIEFYY